MIWDWEFAWQCLPQILQGLGVTLTAVCRWYLHCHCSRVGMDAPPPLFAVAHLVAGSLSRGVHSIHALASSIILLLLRAA